MDEEMKKKDARKGEVGKAGDDGKKKQQIWRKVQPRDHCFLFYFLSFFLSFPRQGSTVLTDENSRFVKIVGTARRSLNCDSD